jgi:hypothetical protein
MLSCLVRITMGRDGSMIPKTFFVRNIIHAIRTNSLRDKNSFRIMTIFCHFRDTAYHLWRQSEALDWES